MIGSSNASRPSSVAESVLDAAVASRHPTPSWTHPMNARMAMSREVAVEAPASR